MSVYRTIGPTLVKYVPPWTQIPTKIYSVNIQYKGFTGSRGGGGTYFKIKNGDDPIFVILTGNKFALIHVSLMRMCN